MKSLVFILVLSPLCIFCQETDLLGQNLDYIPIEHARVRRQAHYRPFSQAPPQIQQLLQSQQAREPLVHLPAQPPPQLGPANRGGGGPQYQSQAQVSQYRPQVQYANAPQQPSYKQVPVAPAPYRPPAGPSAQGAHYPQQQGGQHAGQPNYRAVFRPLPGGQHAAAAGPQPQYNPNLPPQLKQLVQLQQQFPNPVPVANPQHGAQQSKVFQPAQQRLY